MNAALFLTGRCNLRCTYCFANACPRRDMTAEILEQSLDFLHTQNGDRFGITMFGGEPLLCGTLVKRLIFAQKNIAGPRPQLYLSTNGTLLTEEFIDICADEDIGLFLSIDGIEEAHDANRHYANGNGSFRDVVGKAPYLLQRLPYAVAVAVVTPETAEHVSESARYLHSLGFQYILMTPDFSAEWASDHIVVLKEEYQTFAEYYKQSLRQGKKLYFSLFDERIKTRTSRESCPETCCDLGRGSIAISPDGRLFPCVQFVREDAADYCIGHVDTGIDEEARAEIVRKNHAPRTLCKDCALDGRCFNWCGCVNWRTTGEISLVAPFLCEHERMLMPIADEVGNALHDEGNELFLRKFYDKNYAVAAFVENTFQKT